MRSLAPLLMVVLLLSAGELPRALLTEVQSVGRAADVEYLRLVVLLLADGLPLLHRHAVGPQGRALANRGFIRRSRLCLRP